MTNDDEIALAAEAFDSGGGLRVVIDREGGILIANEHWRQFAAAHGGKADMGPDRANYFDVCRRAADAGESGAAKVLATCESVLQDGKARRVDYSCTTLDDPDGAPAYWYSLRISPLSRDRLLLEHVDVTEQQTAMRLAAQEASKAAFDQLVLQTVAQPVIASDLEGTVTYWNAAAEEMFGYPASEALGRLITEVTVPENSREQADEILATLARGERWTGEFWVQHRDGTRFPARVTDIPMLDENGRIVGIVGVSDDLRPYYEREAQQEKVRELEAQLLQRQKLEALGTVAGGVAHEFNNVLAAILANAEMLRDVHLAHGEGRAAAECIVEATQRARDVVYALLTFSRPQSSERHPLDAERWLRSALRLVEPTLSTDVSVTVEWLAPQTTILANETQLTQILLNLASNAAHAMRQGPRRELCIRAAIDQETGDSGAVHVPWFILDVIDTGVGMENSLRARVFDPFFTTKPLGEGTGLGLAMVLGLVTAHEGRIDIESTPGAGTRVRVKLPVNVGLVPAAPLPTQAATTAERGHLLLVDDDVMVLRALTRVLEAAGFSVTSFTDPRHAVRFVEQTSVANYISAAVVDYAMPGLRGDELAAQMALQGFRAPVLICTGNSTEIGVLPPNVRAVIEKPVSGTELIAAITRAKSTGTDFDQR